jgi:hypothetical protein
MGNKPNVGVPTKSDRGLPADQADRFGARKTPAATGPVYPLSDEDARVSRTIARESPEFRSFYVDENIASVEYWSTAYASESPKLRDFRVLYRDGRSRTFRLDEIAVRRPVTSIGSTRYIPVRVGFDKPSYVKRDGFILPDRFDETTTPKLVDIATTIAYNHAQRERFLDTAKLTFEFAIILTYYAAPPETPNFMRTQGKLVRSPIRDVPPIEKPPTKPLRESYEGGTPEAERAIIAGREAERIWGMLVSTEKNTTTFTVRFIDPITGKLHIENVIPDFMPTAEKNSAGLFKSAKNPSEAVLIADSKVKWMEGKNVGIDDQIRAMLVMAARAKKPFVFLVRVGSGVTKPIVEFAKQVGAEIYVVTSQAVR